MAGFPTLKGMWPWPWRLIGSQCTPSSITHSAGPSGGGGKGPGPHKKIAPWAMGRIVARVLPNVSLAMWPSKTLFGPHLIDSGAGTDHSSTSTYTPNFTEIEETFVDVRRLHGRAFETGFTRSTLSKSRPTLLPFPTHLFLYPSLLPLLIHHSAHLLLPLSFTPGSKPTSFTNPRPRRPIYSFTSSSRTASKDYCLDRFFWATRFLFLFFPFFVSGPYARLSWPSRQLLSAR